MSDFRNVRIAVTDSSSLEVEAMMIAEVSSKRPGVDRWTELCVYVTRDGFYIAQEKGKSDRENDKTLINTAIVTGQERLLRFFGNGRLARNLLSTIDIKL